MRFTATRAKTLATSLLIVTAGLGLAACSGSGSSDSTTPATKQTARPRPAVTMRSEVARVLARVAVNRMSSPMRLLVQCQSGMARSCGSGTPSSMELEEEPDDARHE